MRSWKTVAAVLAAATALTGVTTGAMPGEAAAGDAFNPRVQFARSTDAARSHTRFYLRVDQADGEQQIGKLKLSLPGLAHEFSLDTDIPGVNYDDTKDPAGNAASQLGTFHLEAYYSANGNPARTTIAIDGQVFDDNDNASCSGVGECIYVYALIPIPGYPVEIATTIEIPRNTTTGAYEVTADLGDLWNNDVVRQLDIRLKQLIIDLPAKKGAHTTFRNPTVEGTGYSFDYELSSAKIDDLGHAGGQYAACGNGQPVCKIALPTYEYAPTVPAAQSPSNGQLVSTATNVSLYWYASSDRNLDPIDYVVTFDGVERAPQTTLTASVGTLAPGTHTWSVTARDDHGKTTTAGPYTIDVRSLTGALKFTSVATSTDALYVLPGDNSSFFYSVNGRLDQGRLYGANYPGLGASGFINYQGRFSFIGAYDSTVAKSAAGAFQPTTDLRLLTGAGTGTTGA
ncbi:MAG TPA: hypothetical protein VNB24_06715 [Acidimicrobiales bacterium]|nr:hypothetical protein [Acidimicrobiales bacterium]